jgi:hypothetical protein
MNYSDCSTGLAKYTRSRATTLERVRQLNLAGESAVTYAPVQMFFQLLGVYGDTANAVVGLVMPPNFAFMLVLPVAMAVAKPVVLMVAIPGLEEVHVTLLVRI